MTPTRPCVHGAHRVHSVPSPPCNRTALSAWLKVHWVFGWALTMKHQFPSSKHLTMNIEINDLADVFRRVGCNKFDADGNKIFIDLRQPSRVVAASQAAKSSADSPSSQLSPSVKAREGLSTAVWSNNMECLTQVFDRFPVRAPTKLLLQAALEGAFPAEASQSTWLCDEAEKLHLIWNSVFDSWAKHQGSRDITIFRLKLKITDGYRLSGPTPER
jgi:hypothetical protein